MKACSARRQGRPVVRHSPAYSPAQEPRLWPDVGALALDLWAVHPGGKTILDSVEKGLGLPAAALANSREVLACFGNMSSATVMFVLQKIMQRAQPGQQGCAMSFGPGVTAETMLFHVA